MPSVSEVSANAKKLKEQIAEQAGVQKKDLNDSNLKEVSKALDGAKVVASTGQDPTKTPIQDLKAAAGEAPKEESAESLSKQQKIAYAIAAIAPTLIGYAVGGARGGATGAQVSQTALQQIGQYEEKKEARSAAAAEKEKDRQKDLEVAKMRQEDRQLAMQGQAETRELSNQFKRQQLQQMQEAQQKKLSEEEFKKSIEGRMQKLGAEGKQRLDNATLGLVTVQGMADALQKGENTFSVWGDNNFTQQRSLFEEALGRMQSGGAISKEEEMRFKSMAPTFRDSPEIKLQKLQFLQTEMAKRIGTLGFKPEELNIAYNPIQSIQSQQGGGNPMLPKAQAGQAPAAPDFDNMSEEELKKFLGKK